MHASTSVSGSQDSAAVARDADGDFVVVWAGNGTQLLQTDSAGVFFQRYDRNGAAQGAETRVNTTTTGVQRNPAVAMDASGSFVVAWESCDGAGAACDIVLQRFASDGAAAGGETTVNATTADEQTLPAVARAAGGAYVVAWQSLNQDGSGQGIYAQRFDADGTAAGSEFIVNETTAFSQVNPAVAIDLAGNFVIAWSSGDGSGQLNGVFARQFAADGTPGSEFRANVDTAGDQIGAAVSMSADGAFAIAWQGPDADGIGIFMRRYDSGGAPLAGGDEPVNATTTGDQEMPSIALDAGGDIVVAWAGVDADFGGIYFQRFDASGAAQGAETPANVTTTGDQLLPAVAADADGDAVVAWQSDGQDGANYGIYLNRFAGPEDVDLSVTKTDSADPVASGSPYSYTLTVENHHAAVTPTGDAAVDAAIGSATGIVVEDILPAGVGFVGGTGTGWSCDSAGQTVTCAYDAVLAPRATAAVTLGVTAPPGGGEIDNTATVSGNQYDSVTANDSEAEITFACATANAGTLQFSGATFTVGEDGDDAGGSDDGLVTITVTRSDGTCGTASVEVTSTDGSATAGSDYTGLASPVTLTWADGDSAAKTFTIAITEELAHELDTETFNLALQNSDRATLGGNDTAVVNITDNDTPPVVTLSVTGSPFSENAGTATVTATLSKPAGRPVQVNLGYAAGSGANTTGVANRGGGCGTATTPSDYTCSGTAISIAAGASTGSVTLTGVDDTRDENDLEPASITATCRLPNGQSDEDCDDSGAPSAAPEVQDDDAVPALQFSAASASVDESQPVPTQNRTTTITASLSAASDRAVTADFSVAGTAADGADYTLSPTTATANPDFTFSPGQTSKTITATILHDTVDEPNETIVVTLVNPGNATLGANNPHTLTITDDEATPTVQFAPDGGIPGNPSTTDVTEASANPLLVTVTAQLSAESSQTVTVPFTVSGTAVNPEDHDAQAGTLTFAPNQTSAQYTYTVANDALDEADETVILTMGTPTGATVGANATHTTTIADDPADVEPTVQIDTASSTATAAETAGTASIVVSLTPQSGRAVSVQYSIGSGSTASNGSDYTLSPASPLTFAAGETRKTVTVTVINDANNESNAETVIFNLASPTSATLGTPASHTLTIQDDDDLPQVHFTAAAQSAAEGTAGLQATLQLSRSTNVDVTVPFTTGGTTAAGEYALLCPDGLGGTQPCAGELVIPAGQTSASITIDTTEDARVEADETLTLTIGAPQNATKDAPDVHTLTITNDDAAGVTVNPLTADVIEGGAGDNYSLVLTSEPASDVTVNLTVGTEAAVTPGSVTFTPADWNAPKTITVVAVNDALQEGPHGDRVSHAVNSVDLDYQGLAVDDVTVNVTDNDVPAIALTESGGSTDVAEGGATDTYSFVLTTQPTADVVITVTAGPQLARNPATLTFNAGNWNVPQDVTITADDDLVDEPSPHADTVSHSVASGDGSYDGMAVRDVAVNIADNDTAGVTLTESAGSTAVTEGGATDSYTIVLNSQPTADVTVSLAVGPDVSVNPASVTFNAVNWNLGRTITVTAADDDLNEPQENDGITHSVTSADSFYQGIAVGSITVAVTDNDTAGLVVVESAGATAVTEGGATDTFTVALSSQPLANVTIDVDTDPQLAAAPATLTFTPANFATPQTVTVTAVDDGSAEAGHTGTVALATNSTDPDYAGLSAVITATITDNDQVAGGDDAPGVVVTVSGGTVNVASNQRQGGGALSPGALLALFGLLAVRRRRALRAAVLATLALAGGSASAAELSYRYADLRYVSANADPGVDVGGFSLAGSMLLKPDVFLTGSYGSADTDRFRVQGVTGSVQSTSLSVGGGWRRMLRSGLDATGSLSLVHAKSEGEGGFGGSASDTGFALEAGLRGWFAPNVEWGAAVNYLAIFDDGSTSLNAQWLYHATPRFALALGAGFSDEATQFNLGARFGF